MQVSVVLITYEPVINKLISTIVSIINQKGIELELIISDDGSKNVDMDLIESRVRDYVPKTMKFRFIKNPENTGTVLNVFNACIQATGEYTKIISPGDMLYDENVLVDFYQYSKEHPEAGVIFGRAAHYCSNVKLETYGISVPKYPEIYSNINHSTQVLSLMYGHAPVGAAYFYKTETILKYLSMIKEKVKYTEDYTTSILYLLDNNKLYFYDRIIVWYEYGLGISTSNKEKWERIYESDCKALFEVANPLYQNDIYLKFRFGGKREKIKHPLLVLRIYCNNLISKIKAEHILNSEEQIEYLKKLLNAGVGED